MLTILNSVMDYYPILFIAAFLFVIFLMSKNSTRKTERGSKSSQKTEKIDGLMHNQNSGTPTACVVDSLQTEKIEFRGVEDR